jgi:hypothetical protein
MYYKDLSKYIAQFYRNGNVLEKHKKFNGILEDDNNLNQIVDSPDKTGALKKVYKKTIVNKWHVFVMIVNNPSLRRYRKQQYI